MEIRIAAGADAVRRLSDPEFMAAWRALYAVCAHATAFQSPEFAQCWFAHYGEDWEPLIVEGSLTTSGEFVGLLILARHKDSAELAAVGAHQAEYQAWLAQGGQDEAFLTDAVAMLRNLLPSGVLRLRYLPPQISIAWLRESKFGHHTALRHFERPLIRIGQGPTPSERLRKKSNRSRINRLEREAGGTLAASQAADAEALSAVLPVIASDYDARQFEANGLRPFAEDPRKLPFHLDLMRAGLLDAFLLHAGEVLVGGILSIRNRDELAVGVFAHSTALADHSPGKFAMLYYEEAAQREGWLAIDLTPGGDWKLRFANEVGSVEELTIYFDRSAAARARAAEKVRGLAKRGLALLGLTPPRLRRLAGKLRR